MTTELRSVIVSANLELLVPFPAAVAESLARDAETIRQALDMMPDHARPRFTTFREFSPLVTEAEGALDWPAIRAEFARKAKKIGLTAHNDVSIFTEARGWRMTCIAHGRA